eukprot:scaffold179412_cov82-Attheya_sp.AAC.1
MIILCISRGGDKVVVIEVGEKEVLFKYGYTALSGTSTETGVETENHELENILDSVDELVLDTEFIDELDFDGDSISTNPPDLDDLDIDLEESSM